MNCKPGDLAYIVKSDFRCNIGAIVEVVARAEPDEFQEIGIWWHVRAHGLCPIAFSFYGNPLETIDGFSMECDCMDDDLRPINGVPVHDEITDEVTT